MRIYKSQYLYFNALICLALIIPFFNISQTGLKANMFDINGLSPQLFENSPNSNNFLFSYKQSEKESIAQILYKFKPSHFHFFRNFPVGFVTLKTKNIEEISIRYPKIFSRLHISEKTQVIPSSDKLQLQSLTKSQQSEYIAPASIIRATELYDLGVYGSDVKIAIIDSGIDDTHSDFTGRIDYQKSFINSTFGFSSSEDYEDSHGHGTHVAGIAAGGGSYPGIAYNARLYNLKAVNMAGYSTEESVLAAIDEAIDQEVDIISISLGSGESLPWEFADYMSLAVDSAVDDGTVVVVAAGNEGENNPLATISSPAAASKAITVGATNGSAKVVSFSSRGPSFSYRMDPDVVAPGYQIIAPLASDSVLDLAFNAIVEISLSDYIVLSGTSMAAPVVSGAVALLKQQFPTATPAVLRAALQESAVDLGSYETVYTQGSGLIDVAEALALLEDTENSNGFDLISSVPRANTNKPIEFADRVEFPGDKARMTLSFVTGTGGTISWQISDRIKKFVSFDTNDQDISGSGYFEKSLNVSIPFDTIPDVYKGNINYNFLGKSYSIPFSFTIKNPIAKVYLDTHYTGKDDSIFFNYRTLDEFLVSNSSLDINEYETAITRENLSQNDILVLTDLEYPISNREIEFISEFHEHNGSILLVTSAFPYFNPHPYSQIVEKLRFSVDFSDRVDLIDYNDNGRSRDIVVVPPEEQKIHWDSDNPLLIGVDQFPSFIGTGFKISQSEPSLKYPVEVLSSYLMVAAFEPSDKGKLLILGSETLLYPDFLSTSSGQNFVCNIFDWLRPKTGLSVNANINSDMRLLEIAAYNSTSYLSDLSVNITFSNGTPQLETKIPFNTTLGFYYDSIGLGVQQDQEISIVIRNSTSTLKNIILIDVSPTTFPEILDIKINSIVSSEILNPSWADDESSLNLIDQGLNISLTHNASNSIESSVLITSQFEDTLDVIIPPLEGMEYYLFEKELNKSSTSQSLVWEIPSNLSTGFYSYEIKVWMLLENNSSSNVLLTIERDLFYIPDSEPILHDASTIGGQTLDIYRNIQTSADMPIWDPGDTIDIQLYGKDNNSNEFDVHIHFMHYYLWYADQLVLDHFRIPPSTNRSENIGEFLVPSGSIPIPNEDDFSVETNNQIFLLLVFIRDAQGNSVIEPIFFGIGSSFFMDPTLFFALGLFFVLIAGGIVIYLVRRSSARRTGYYARPESFSYSYPPPSSSKIYIGSKFCPTCRSEVPIEAFYCSSCGSYLGSDSSKE